MSLPLFKLYLLWCAGAFLSGSIPFGLLLVRLAGKGDVRTQGSGNIGATNVMRAGGKALGIATLLLDAGKGFLPVFLARHLGYQPEFLAFVALAAVAGHVFTPWLKFKGGKGVATAAGVLLGISPLLGLAAGATWLIMAYFFRFSSLASLTAAVFAPVYYIFGDGVAWYLNKGVVLALSVMSILLIYRHVENIGKLLKGTESRLGHKAKH